MTEHARRPGLRGPGVARQLHRRVERILESPSPSDDASGTVALTVDETDLERARFALRSLSRSGDAECVSLAATRVEIALERYVDRARSAPGPIEVDLDATVVALVCLALFERSSTRSDPYHRQGREYLERLRTDDPALSDAVATVR